MLTNTTDQMTTFHFDRCPLVPLAGGHRALVLALAKMR